MHQTTTSKDLDYTIVFIKDWHCVAPAGHGDRVQNCLTHEYSEKRSQEIWKAQLAQLSLFYKILRSIIKSFHDDQPELWMWIQAMGTSIKISHPNGSQIIGADVWEAAFFIPRILLLFPFYKFLSRVKQCSCGNMRAQFLLVTSIERLKWEAELALSFLAEAHLGCLSRLVCNLEYVCVCVVLSWWFFFRLNSLLLFL